MSLQDELRLPNPFTHKSHEAVFNIVITGTLLSKEGERILRPFGLTDAQFNILMLLKYQAVEGKINQTQLSNMLLVNRANVTGLIDRMEKAGLVRRTADPEDRRVNNVEMTGKGRELLEKSHTIYHQRLDNVMSSLSGSGYRTLCSILETIRERLNDKEENSLGKHVK